MTRECGQCSMCCKVLYIRELSKPANKWCEHISRTGGCGIYDTRFPICRGYRCQWLLDEELGPEWQPNKCKFIVHRAEDSIGVWVNVDLSSPLAWRREPFYSQIKLWSQVARDGSAYVAVCIGERVFVIFPEQDLPVPALPQDADLKVGYRHAGNTVTPLVQVRNGDGTITEYLGSPVPKTA